MNVKKAEAIVLLAFLLMVKNVQANSVLYDAAAYKMAARIGVGDGRTFKKYLNRCLELNLCVDTGQSSNSQGRTFIFISYRDALSRLLGINKYQARQFPLHRGLGKMALYKEQIEKELAGLNFSQQAYMIRCNFPNKLNIINKLKELNELPVSERYSRANCARRKRLIKKLSTIDEQIAKSSRRGHQRSIVTGCKHLGATIGKSSTTANKRINKWIAEGVFKAKDVVVFTPVTSELNAHMIVDAFSATGAKGIPVYSKKEGGVKHILGKRVLQFDTSVCKIDVAGGVEYLNRNNKPKGGDDSSS